MDILFDAQLPSGAVPPAFVLTFDPEAMSLQCIGDMATISVQAFMTRRHPFWSRQQFRGLYPVLYALHGILYGSSLFQGNHGIGASLVSTESFPLAFPDENTQLLNLAFHCSRSYLQRIEDDRASNPGSILNLGIAFWTAMGLVPSTPITSEDTIPMQSSYQDKLIHLKSRQGEFVRISRSHWS